MLASILTKAYVAVVTAICVASLVYVYAFPPPSMFASRDGVPHFTPAVAHPETGEPIELGTLIRHYRGD